MPLRSTKYLPAALLVFALLLGAVPGSAASSYPATARYESSIRAAAAGAPDREIFGFALASSLSDPTIGYPSWNFSLLSTVAYFGLHVNDDGTFAADQGMTVWNSSALTSFVSAAHAKGTKVVVTIIEQDFSSNTPHMCAALAHTGVTITNTVDAMKAKGVDGVNVDYEGLNGSCGSPTDSSYARHTFTQFIANLRAAMPAGSYLSVDTYASSAADTVGFFDVPGLAASADSLFVMAYDLEYSNYYQSPTKCGSFCLGPTAPLSTYHYTDTGTAQQYVNVVPSSKVILGVPYYGRKACVGGALPNQFPIGAVTADTYLDAVAEDTSPDVLSGSFNAHRDGNDPAGQERWDTWYNTSLKCTRELYWDDTISLGNKYDVVNAFNLRGAGIWNLNYGGGAPELWNLISLKFTTTTSWASLGGLVTAGAATSSWGSSRTDVFVRGSDNAVYQKTWNGTAWSGWTSLGGAASAGPAAVSWGANRIDLFVRGSDAALYHRVWNGTAWSGWERLGGLLTSGPAVASWAPGRLDVFARGGDNALYHLAWTGTAWSGWERLGGALTSDPAAVSWAANRIDVVVRGTDNALWHRVWNGAKWTAWESLGGALSSGPAITSCASGHLDAFVLGSDRALYRLGFNGATWGAWQRLGGYWTSDPGASCAPGTTSVNVFETGTDGALWQSAVPGS
jgi:spore germination protein YaaH